MNSLTRELPYNFFPFSLNDQTATKALMLPKTIFSVRFSGLLHAIKKQISAVAAKNRYLYLSSFIISNFRSCRRDKASIFGITSKLPNINRIDVSLRRLFVPNLPARTQGEKDHNHCNKHEPKKHGNRNQYFYPEFHIERTEKAVKFAYAFCFEIKRHIAPTTRYVMPMMSLFARLSVLSAAPKNSSPVSTKINTYPYFLKYFIKRAAIYLTDKVRYTPNPKISSPSTANRMGINFESFMSFKFTRKERACAVTFMTNTKCPALRHPPHPFNFRALRPADLRLPFVGKISECDDQPDDHDKPHGRDNEPKQSFYKFHQVDLHHPVRPFEAYVFSLLCLFAPGKVSDTDNGYEHQREQCGRGNDFNKEFHKFQSKRIRNRAFKEAIKNRGLIESRFQN